MTNISPVSEARHVPRIARYHLPGASMMQGNRVSWPIISEKAALLVHDMQNYWVDRFEDSSELVTNIAALVCAARAKGMPIIYSVARREPRLVDRGLALDMWGAGMGGGREDPRDEQIITELANEADDLIVEKRKYSAFFRTGLGETLKDLGIDQLVVTGVYAHHGCLLSAADAYMRDVKPFFVVDATADHSEEQHLMTCRLIPSLCGQNETTNRLLQALS